MGAPKDFLSVIAGYELSKDNFLRFLGGPYNALTTYIVCLLIFISVPRKYLLALSGVFLHIHRNLRELV
jgi:hypothetical protein